MFVGGSGVKICFYGAILDWNHDIKEWYVSERVWTCEFDGGMQFVKIIDKHFQFLWAFGPNHENVIDKSEPYQVDGVRDGEGFRIYPSVQEN